MRQADRLIILILALGFAYLLKEPLLLKIIFFSVGFGAGLSFLSELAFEFFELLQDSVIKRK